MLWCGGHWSSSRIDFPSTCKSADVSHPPHFFPADDFVSTRWLRYRFCWHPSQTTCPWFLKAIFRSKFGCHYLRKSRLACWESISILNSIDLYLERGKGNEFVFNYFIKAILLFCFPRLKYPICCFETFGKTEFLLFFY